MIDAIQSCVPLQGSGLPPVLALDRIGKWFGAVHALDDVSISLQPGTVLGLVGENGAGKSTLARIAAGVVEPDSGTIRLDGRQVHFRSPIDAHRAGIQMAPQELLLVPQLSVAENVALGHIPGSRLVISGREMRAQARERLKRFGLIHIDVDQPAETLPVVEQAFVQIARSIVPGTRVLIADEPTAPMSGTETERLLNLIRAVTAQGVAVIYVSHRLDEVFHLAERVAVLRDGTKVDEFDASGLSREKLVTAMVGTRSLEIPAHAIGEVGSTPLLSVHRLSAGSIEDVSFDVRAGEIVAVYGIAGSGRDELGPALAGAAPRSGGDVVIVGRHLPSGRSTSAIAAGVGYVPAERRSQGLVMSMSVRENLTLGILKRLSRFGVLRKRYERRLARQWMGNLRLAAPSTETIVDTLSGGNQQKVLLARWLVAESKVLILDEPTRGVDIATKAEIYRILRGLADGGTGVLVVSSDLEEVSIVGDRVLVVRNGRIVAEMRDASQEHIVRAALASEEDRGA